MGQIKINPQTQIRWKDGIVPITGDFPVESLPHHHETHEDGGSDEVQLDISQVTGLQDIIDNTADLLQSDEDETVTGDWTFTQPVTFSGISTDILELDILAFQAIPRPTDLVLGESYRDIGTNLLYLQTNSGVRAFILLDLAPPIVGITQQGQALAYIQGIYSYTSAQAQAYILNIIGFAQAQARIHQKYTVSAQAKARIVSRPYKFAQARARIESTTPRFGQAQAFVNNLLFFGFGQATTYINIKYPNQGFAQAGATIV